MAIGAVEFSDLAASPEPKDEALEHLVQKQNDVVLELSRFHAPKSDFPELDDVCEVKAIVSVVDGASRVEYGLYGLKEVTAQDEGIFPGVAILATINPTSAIILEELVMVTQGSSQDLNSFLNTRLYYPRQGSSLAFNLCYSETGRLEVRNRLWGEGSINVITGPRKLRRERHLKVLPAYPGD